ncbi:hypothetical protein [Nitrosomonas eutropha]|uniref:hypothetical protein n=1 Tax=Nitrosomonas eutropha TaxID=916 RepID=UPI00115FDFE5|nr:hypothetical protein [Nitrosomonas eutropha]
MSRDNWHVRVRLQARLPTSVTAPQKLLPAAQLDFQGVRSMHRRAGFGAELVAVLHPQRRIIIMQPFASC